MAFIIAAGITHSMAGEVDCANARTFKGKATEEYDGSADACISDHSLVAANPKMADKVLKTYCNKKNMQMSGSKWKPKKPVFYTQENCDMLGATLDCATALKACSKRPAEKKEECAEKIKIDKKKGIDCRVEGVFDPLLEALLAGTPPFAAA